jgi:hypothetical protein
MEAGIYSSGESFIPLAHIGFPVLAREAGVPRDRAPRLAISATTQGYRVVKNVPHTVRFNSKVVVSGDFTQVDLRASGLSGLIEIRSILKSVPGISFVCVNEKAVGRREPVSGIIRAYEVHDAAQAGPGGETGDQTDRGAASAAG